MFWQHTGDELFGVSRTSIVPSKAPKQQVGPGFCPSVGPGKLTGMICPFCNVDAALIVLDNEVGIALRDAFPVTEGHTLVIPKKHVVSLFDLSGNEQAVLWQLAAEVRALLIEEFHPAGFNVGVNDGEAAGQTVMHAHIHVIPRYTGDATDPRGGVRRIIPRKARYWEGQSDDLSTPPDDRHETEPEPRTKEVLRWQTKTRRTEQPATSRSCR